MATGKPPWSNYSNPVTALYQVLAVRRNTHKNKHAIDAKRAILLHTLTLFAIPLDSQIACRRAPPPMPEDMDELGKKFLDLCFKTAPDERSSTDELLLHHFVRDNNSLNRTAEFSRNYATPSIAETDLPGSVKESMASPGKQAQVTLVYTKPSVTSPFHDFTVLSSS